MDIRRREQRNRLNHLGHSIRTQMRSVLNSIEMLINEADDVERGDCDDRTVAPEFSKKMKQIQRLLNELNTDATKLVSAKQPSSEILEVNTNIKTNGGALWKKLNTKFLA